MAVIFFFSAQPSLPGPSDPVLSIIVRKTGHLVEYAILMLLLLRAIGVTQLAGWRPVMLCFLALIVYAISDEVHQAFVANRQSSIIDVFIDTLGGLIGLGIFRLLVKRNTVKLLVIYSRKAYK
jgi:VanZ family protein